MAKWRRRSFDGVYSLWLTCCARLTSTWSFNNTLRSRSSHERQIWSVDTSALMPVAVWTTLMHCCVSSILKRTTSSRYEVVIFINKAIVDSKLRPRLSYCTLHATNAWQLCSRVVIEAHWHAFKLIIVVLSLTSSRKPEVRNVLHCIQMRNEPRPQVTRVENFVKFGRVVFTARAMIALQALY